MTMEKVLEGVSVNGVAVSRYLLAQSLKEINEVKNEDRVFIYKAPSVNRAWSPYRGRCSRVRRIEVLNVT